MSRPVLVIPAAGLGSRLGADVPKLLVPVGGMPMIDRLERLYKEVVSRIVLIVHPSFEAAVRQHVGRWADAGRTASSRASRPACSTRSCSPRTRYVPAAGDGVWITWCDQVAVHPSTVRTLAETSAANPEAALVMPTVATASPRTSIWSGDDGGRILRVLHRREGDAHARRRGERHGAVRAAPRRRTSISCPQYERDVAIGPPDGRAQLPAVHSVGWPSGTTS